MVGGGGGGGVVTNVGRTCGPTPLPYEMMQ